MNEVSFELFLPEVLPYMPAVPEVVAVNAIRNAAIEFCNLSHIWLVEHDPLTTLEAVACYELEAPVDAQVTRIHQAWFDGSRLVQASEDELMRLFGPSWYTMTGTPRYISQMSHLEVRLTPTPLDRTVGGLRMLVALAPLRTSTTIDESIYQRWAEQIAYGARARLYETPNQSYYDPKAAVYYRRLFHAAIGEAKVERNRGLTRAQPHMRPAAGTV